jgi:hypothetical protein
MKLCPDKFNGTGVGSVAKANRLVLLCKFDHLVLVRDARSLRLDRGVELHTCASSSSVSSASVL